MSWIKLETHTFDKVEIYLISKELGIDPDSALGKCCRVWAWFDANTTDGVTKSVTKALLDRYCGVTGFCDAMIKAGWMDEAGDVIQLPYYDRHNSKTAKARCLGANRQSKFKSNAAGNATGNAKGNADGNGQALPKSSHREDKIREDKELDNTIVLSVAGDSANKKNCPHKAIVDLYHEILPASPTIRDWTPARAELLRVRWNEKPERQDTEWWRRFFEYISQSPFLTGKKTGLDSRPFTPGLEWILKAENFAKIREGRYHQDAA